MRNQKGSNNLASDQETVNFLAEKSKGSNDLALNKQNGTCKAQLKRNGSQFK